MKYRLLYPMIMLLLSASPVFGSSVIYEYDELDRLQVVTLENGKKIAYEYDEIGNMISKTLPLCAGGYTYKAGRSRCEFTPPICVAGTNFNYAANRCESIPSCGSGVYSVTTNNCVSVGSYAATRTGAFAGTVPVYEMPVNYGEGGDTCNGSARLASSSICGIRGYMAATAFAGSVPVYEMSVNFGEGGDTCYGSAGLASSSICSIRGYMSATAFTGSAPVYESPVNYGEGGDTCNGSTGLASSSICGIRGYMAVSPGLSGGTYICPSGGTVSGSTCNTVAYTTATCQSGATLDTVADKCIANPTCADGTFDGTNGVCYIASH